MNYVRHNEIAWNFEVGKHNTWTVPVDHDAIEQVRQGNLAVSITTFRTVPKAWLQDIKGKRVLCLAGGGGQQGPLLSAAGAIVTVLDMSSKQLEQDQLVARRENLDITTVQGDMQDLSQFADACFDMIINPISNCFVEDLKSVWKGCARILKQGGSLLCGITNPTLYIFDEHAEQQGKLKIKYTLPYSDLTSISKKQLQKMLDKNDTIEFSHTWESQLGGLCAAGFAITGFYSDASGFEPLDSYIGECYLGIRAVKG